ncbi:MAG: hypothetical protein JW958_09115 [Candidatus Eisenbacteria bacterium]|nr:hypothetical protein [Candidatus Eisenbacteria bacterium]
MKPNDPIERGLRRLAEETPPPGHMTRTLAAARAGVRRRERMNRLFGRTAMAGVFACVLLLVLVFIPVSYDLRVGSVVEAELVPDFGRSPEELDRALFLIQERISRAEGIVRGRAERIEDRVAVRLLAARGPVEAQAIIDGMIDKETGLRRTALEVKELKIRLGGNVLAWASGGRIRINVRGATAEELEEAIREELARQGLEASEVHVETSGDGNITTVEITTPEGSAPEGEGNGEVTIDLQMTLEEE